MKLLIIMILFPIFASAKVKDPSDIVRYAFTSLTNGQVSNLVSITDSTELKKIQKLLTQIENKETSMDSIINQYRLVKSWTIENAKEHKIQGRNLYLVSTKWEMKIPVERNNPTQIVESNANNINTIHMDYLLEKIDNQWKIISTKTRY